MRNTFTISFLVALVICGCTVRGGWPRFLRKGEPSDAQMKRAFDAQNVKDGMIYTNGQLMSVTDNWANFSKQFQTTNKTAADFKKGLGHTN